MLRLVSDLVGVPIVAEADGQALGRCTGIVFDSEKGKVLAFGLAGGRYVSTVDIRAYLSEGLIVGEINAAQPLDDLPTVQEAEKKGIRPVGVKAITAKGNRLGKVSDAELETDGHFIVKLHVKPPWWRPAGRDLIIPRERVVRYEPGRVVVRYDDGERPAAVEPEVAS